MPYAQLRPRRPLLRVLFMWLLPAKTEFDGLKLLHRPTPNPALTTHLRTRYRRTSLRQTTKHQTNWHPTSSPQTNWHQTMTPPTSLRQTRTPQTS